MNVIILRMNCHAHVRRTFADPPDKLPMPAMASNRMVLEEFIRKHYMTSVFNACKRQHCPVTAGPATHENPHLRGCFSYVLQETGVPLHFMAEVCAGLEADVVQTTRVCNREINWLT